MALREKKSAFLKPGGDTTGAYSTDGTSAAGFEGLMARLQHSGILDSQEKNYYVYEVSNLYQLSQQGATVVEKDLEASIKECNKRIIEDSMSQDNLASSGEKTKLSNLTLNEIDVVEEADLISFHAEKLKNKSLTFRELCSLVIEHLLGVKSRNIHGGQLNESYLFSTEISGYVVLLYGKISSMFQNDLSLDSYLTLFELVGQDIAKTQSDMKIKSDSELPTLKEKMKKSEATWKNLQGILLRKLAGYVDGKAFLLEPQSPWSKQPKSAKDCPQYKTRLFNLIRFQVQLAITSPSLVKDSNLQAQERMKLFVEKVYDSMASLLTKYLLIEHYEQNHLSEHAIATNSFLVESFDLSANQNTQKQIPLESKEADKLIQDYLAGLDDHTREGLLDKKVEFYWTDLGGLSPNHISKSKSRKIEPSARQVSMKVVLSSHYSKRSYKEFLDFCDSFGHYYERYFSETEFGANPLEVLSNFSKLVFLLMKAFSLPGRTGSDDLRSLLNQLLANLRIPQILPWIIRSLRILIRQESGLVETEALRTARQSITDPERNLEFRLLGVNLLRLIQFVLHHAEGETTCINQLLKVTYFLHYCMWTDTAGNPDERVFKLHRLIHLLIHKNTNGCCIKVHSVGFDTELKLFVLNMQVNLLVRKLNPSATESEVRKRRSSQMHDEQGYEIRDMSHRRISLPGESDQTAADVEKEIVQMLRCFYCRFVLIQSFSLKSATI